MRIDVIECIVLLLITTDIFITNYALTNHTDNIVEKNTFVSNNIHNPIFLIIATFIIIKTLFVLIDYLSSMQKEGLAARLLESFNHTFKAFVIIAYVFIIANNIIVIANTT